MNPDDPDLFGVQPDLFEELQARSVLDRLLLESRLYRSSREYGDLLDFVARLRGFAPFNAMLLHIQKPGLRFAASARDWRRRFGRHPRERARPLIILQPFGPVSLVYDLMDTEGSPVPRDVEAFPAQGLVLAGDIEHYRERLAQRAIEWIEVDAGDGRAGWIRLLTGAGEAERRRYRMGINRNHPLKTQFVTLAHELGHLFLGHLGGDETLGIADRRQTGEVQKELEAESVAYIVCGRNGVEARSQPYLSNFLDRKTAVTQAEVYHVMRASGRVETLLGLAGEARYEAPPSLNGALDL